MKKMALLISIFALFVTIGAAKCDAAENSHIIEISEKIVPKSSVISTDMQVKHKAPSTHPVEEISKKEERSENENFVNDYSEYPAPAPAYVPNDPNIASMGQCRSQCCEKCACNKDCDCGETCTCSKGDRCSKGCDCNKAACKCEKNCKCKAGNCKCDKTVCRCKKCNPQMSSTTPPVK